MSEKDIANLQADVKDGMRMGYSDSMVDFYCSYIGKEYPCSACHVASTFLYTSLEASATDDVKFRRIGKHIRTENLKFLVLPIVKGEHWSVLFIGQPYCPEKAFGLHIDPLKKDDRLPDHRVNVGLLRQFLANLQIY